MWDGGPRTILFSGTIVMGQLLVDCRRLTVGFWNGNGNVNVGR